MSQLVVRDARGETAHLIGKRLTTLGTEALHDIRVELPRGSAGVLFTLSREEGACELVPARQRVRVNGAVVGRPQRLKSCDRIEWDGGSAVYLESPVPARAGGAGAAEEGAPTLSTLQNLVNALHRHSDYGAALRELADILVQITGAEEGYLLSERDGDGGAGWHLIASSSAERELNDPANPARERRNIFSSTILREAIEKRRPVYIQSMIGSPHAEAASIVQSRIFSAACFPLIVGGRVFGAVFLHTRTPGRSIDRERLGEVSILATQAALLLACSAGPGGEADRAPGFAAGAVDPSGEPAFITAPDGSGPMPEALRRIAKLGPTPLHVLVLGETGVGKEIAARELHRLSPRRNGPFVAVNCAAIPATLLESTLFGYERGAFTGAVRAQRGKFEAAHGGTLFLDEIGDLSLDLQAKLLRAIQEKQVEPLGARAPLVRRADRRGHAPQPAAHGGGGEFPPGPLLPARRRDRGATAAARAARRYRAACRALSPDGGYRPPTLVRGARPPARTPVAGKRARVGTGRFARGATRRRPGDRSGGSGSATHAYAVRGRVLVLGPFRAARRRATCFHAPFRGRRARQGAGQPCPCRATSRDLRAHALPDPRRRRNRVAG